MRSFCLAPGRLLPVVRRAPSLDIWFLGVLVLRAGCRCCSLVGIGVAAVAALGLKFFMPRFWFVAVVVVVVVDSRC